MNVVTKVKVPSRPNSHIKGRYRYILTLLHSATVSYFCSLV